ncbi:putative GCY1-galactose-induced protein of aldo/keto reductase family [Myxozyma melibiosi]|uniref:GCY1-galactose-induced protein of aldo/keto reductase family n=1 Tax=Myxozyma melibiosi TaxID=54550 RepID=A0ABR1F009_9ASCO
MSTKLCQQKIKLNTGQLMPAVGYGTWQGKPDVNGSTELQDAIVVALEEGYRHIDTAAAYGVEPDVAAAIKKSGVPREELFIVTKLWNTDHDDVEAAFLKSLEKLDTEYIDLYLMHFPQANGAGGVALEHPTPAETWLNMEAVIKKYPTKLRAIGVSNFSKKTIDQLLEVATIKPAVNQVEVNPMWPQPELRAYFEGLGIHITAYSPLGQWDSPLLTDPEIAAIAAKYNVGVGTLLLSWCLANGVSVIPKSARRERMHANINLLKNLEPEDKKFLDEFHFKEGMHRRLCLAGDGTRPTGKELIFGWTYEQMGWETFFVDTDERRPM